MFEPDRDTEVRTPPASGMFNQNNAGLWVCQVPSKRTESPSESTHLPITAKGVIVGADGNCDVVIDDPAVSSRHLSIRLNDKGILLEDLKSTNGTFIRSTQIDKVLVTTRTTITLGNSELHIFPPSQFDIPPCAENQFGGLVGSSVTMRKVFAVMKLAALSDATVVIEGESGTGKEVAARAIHENSNRRNQPFVTVDCAGVPDTLIESQLFGHKSGAFTGAVQDRKGAFVIADGGTIFLDELGELSLTAQAKLLRVLEAQTVQPLGEDRPVAVNVRVIAATNRNLEQMVQHKQFRFDLFHRLSVVHFQMPPLREHPDDIPMLVGHFYRNRNAAAGPVEGKGLMELVQYDWPGNVRELRNVLERAWVLSGMPQPPFARLSFAFGRRVEPSQNGVIDTSIPYKEAKERWLDIFEAKYIESVFKEHNGNISKAAGHSDLNRNHFRKLLEKHNLLKP